MESLLLRLSPVFQLTRITTAFAAVGGVWFVLLWTRGNGAERSRAPAAVIDLPAWVVLGGGAMFAVGLFAFAMALNDTLDIRRDRVLNPERPLPAGRLSVNTAVGLVSGTLLASLLGAAVLGLPAVLIALLTAVAILLYNAAGKYVPSVGLVALGMIYAAPMLAANAELAFLWPVWLAMTHMLAVGAVSHRLAGRRPELTPPMLGAAAAGWLAAGAVLLYLAVARAGTVWPSWVSPWAAIGPAVLAALFVGFAVRKVRSVASRPRAAEKIQRYGSLWLTLYGVAWLVGQGLTAEAGLLVALAAAGLLGMTVLREAYNLIEHPVGYRV
ncbi:MAG: UbiA family prenyltransferase [Phycisphaerales bacterium]|nr:UbiA family prenyltransferase [Phycisphaerales bacterium]